MQILGEILAAAAICVVVILLTRPLLIRHALAHPNARSSHKIPTPQGGGIGVVGAALAVALAVGTATQPHLTVSQIAPLAAATVLLAVLGAADDLRPLPVRLRLLVQFIAVGAVAATLPESLGPGWLPGWVRGTVVVVAGMWFVNLVNFMDGIDLMTVAEVTPISAAMLGLGGLGALPPEGSIIAAALLGGMIGFAPFNRPVARLFLGDVGSLPVGLLMGWLLARIAAGGHAAAALLLPAYYLADSTLTLLIRLAAGQRVWVAHRSHFYQRATDGGFSVMSIVSRVFAVNLALAALAVATVIWPDRTTAVAALAVGGALVGWLLTVFARRKR
jgi:UDP-N-acetylmuramyl pentapeptide phosphotransferase/UDP-N-acetylglucosamine-1-phosphate transferase